jgi:hypothetical protein
MHTRSHHGSSSNRPIRPQCIVALRTVDGFGVCFSLPRQQQIELGETLVARLAPKITHCAN